MKAYLAPTLSQQVGANYILWIKNSNQYIVLDKNLYELIAIFLNAENTESFIEQLSKLGIEPNLANDYLKEIIQLLEDCNSISEKQLVPDTEFRSSFRNLSKTYKIGNDHIKIYYNSEELKQLIHPPLEHLQASSLISNYLCEFDIYEDKGVLSLFKNKTPLGSWPSKDHHLLQGKFAMNLLCAIHDNEEMDWIGTLHASTVVRKDQAIMVIGDSGKGKSTFTALLLGHSYEILADDITPVLATDSLVYPYPGAISIKAGSFDILKSGLAGFDELPQHYINPYKGYVKYVGTPINKGYLKGYPCKNIVRINYIKDSQTKLETISIAKALNTLIPESWLAHKKYNAKQFLNWIKDVQFYELTYSDSKEAIDLFSSLLME
jgi:hypothetical protein